MFAPAAAARRGRSRGAAAPAPVRAAVVSVGARSRRARSSGRRPEGEEPEGQPGAAPAREEQAAARGRTATMAATPLAAAAAAPAAAAAATVDLTSTWDIGATVLKPLRMPPRASASPSPPRGVRFGAAPRDVYKDKYTGEGGLALDTWASRAGRALEFFKGLDDAGAVSWLATALEGAAGDWYSGLVDTEGKPPSPQALIAGLRSRFQPVNSAEVARLDLDELRQGKGTVNEYTTHFHRLVAHLPLMDAGSRMHHYCRGLDKGIMDRIVQMTPQPASLTAMVEVAARIEGRGSRSAQAGQTESLAAATTSVTHEDLRGRVAELEALVRTLVPLAASSAGDSRGRFAGARVAEDNRRQVPGLSSEEARRRMDKGLCLYCSRPSHIARDCVDRVTHKPPTLTEA